MLDILIEIDRTFFLFLNSFNSPFFDTLMYYISNKYTWIPLYVVLAALMGIRYRWKALFILIFVVILITLSDQLSVAFKNYFMRPRPCHEPDLASLVHIVRNKCGGQFGFVSSHATNSFALAVFMGKMLKDRFGFIYPVLIVYALLNSYSRIYLGVHYPADVIGGALLGTIIALFVFFLNKQFDKKVFRKQNQREPKLMIR